MLTMSRFDDTPILFIAVIKSVKLQKELLAEKNQLRFLLKD